MQTIIKKTTIWAGMLATIAFLAAGAPAKILDTLQIEGLLINSSSVVQNTFGIGKGQTFDASSVSDGISELSSLGLFKSVDVFVKNETDSSATLLIRVEEYPICESFEWSGTKKIKKDDLEEKLTLKKGQIVSDVLLFENAAAIKKQYADKGYLHAAVTTQLLPSRVPGNVMVKFSVNEGTKVQIKTITFHGNAAFKESKLKGQFKTKEKRWWSSGDFDEALYKNHLDTLVMFYNDQGYLDAEIARDSVWYAANQKDLFIDITIKEGHKYYAGDFSFAGNTTLATDSLLSQVALKRGKPFQKSKFDLTKGMIENRYREEGFLWVQVRDSRSYRGDTLDVGFSILEGKPAIIRKVDISGNLKTADFVVRREVRLMPGQKYKQSLVARSYREITNLNFFSNVNVLPRPIDEAAGLVDVLFEVSEKENIGQLSVGAAYSKTDALVGTFTLGIPNFRGRGEDLSMNLEYGPNRKTASVGFAEPWAFNTPTRLTTNIHYTDTKYSYTSGGSSYDRLVTWGLGIGAGRALKWPDDYFRLDGGYGFDRLEEYGVDTTITPTVKVLPRGWKSDLSFTLSRNDALGRDFPTDGSIFRVTPEIVGLGGDYKFVRALLSYDWYFPLKWKFVFGTKTKLGVLSGLGSSAAVISQSDLFSAGGVFYASNWNGVIHGYNNYSIGGYPHNGTAMLTMSAELRYPLLPDQIYLGAFTDMGNCWGSVSRIDLGQLYQGAGVGLRIAIPMLGIMGFDFSWPLVAPPGSNADALGSYKIPGAPKIDFSIGKGF